VADQEDRDFFFTLFCTRAEYGDCNQKMEQATIALLRVVQLAPASDDDGNAYFVQTLLTGDWGFCVDSARRLMAVCPAHIALLKQLAAKGQLAGASDPHFPRKS
jgi:hypothetical protein